MREVPVPRPGHIQIPCCWRDAGRFLVKLGLEQVAVSVASPGPANINLYAFRTTNSAETAISTLCEDCPTKLLHIDMFTKMTSPHDHAQDPPTTPRLGSEHESSYFLSRFFPNPHMFRVESHVPSINVLWFMQEPGEGSTYGS